MELAQIITVMISMGIAEPSISDKEATELFHDNEREVMEWKDKKDAEIAAFIKENPTAFEKMQARLEELGKGN